MTDYNDGKWHGWNGGECPVNPKTRLQAVEENGCRWEADAEDCDWHSFRGAFRVVKEHREPVEVWFKNHVEIGWRETTKNTPGARLFREVLE